MGYHAKMGLNGHGHPIIRKSLRQNHLYFRCGMTVTVRARYSNVAVEVISKPMTVSVSSPSWANGSKISFPRWSICPAKETSIWIDARKWNHREMGDSPNWGNNMMENDGKWRKMMENDDQSQRWSQLFWGQKRVGSVWLKQTTSRAVTHSDHNVANR